MNGVQTWTGRLTSAGMPAKHNVLSAEEGIHGMGFFNFLYVVECERRGADSVALTTSVFGGELGEASLFTWIEGDVPQGLQGYAGNTIFCSQELPLMPAYPRTSVQKLGEKARNGPPSSLIEVDWQPGASHSSTVVHVVLPENYVPRSDLMPLEQPRSPFVKLCGERFVLTWGADGQVVIRFCATPLNPQEALEEFNTSALLGAKRTGKWKKTIGLNLHFAKFEVRET